MIAHATPAGDVAHALGTDTQRGLPSGVAAARLESEGANRLRRPSRPPYGRLLLNEVADPLVLLLVAATVVSVAMGDVVEATAIAAVLLLNGALGFWQDLTADQAIRALSETFVQPAAVVRDGEVLQIPAAEVVRGDVLAVGEGERVAADGRIVESHGLDVDESMLTGESLPVAKHTRPVPADAPLAERSSMVYAGSAVTRGRGRVLVCATGADTEIGTIEALAGSAKPPPTPLERRLVRLARQLAVGGVAVTVLLTTAMLLRGAPIRDAFLVGVAVAVAAVPEGLAATVTAALALGARSMARRGAIVRRLEAVETLGGTTVVLTDKTGTLTENRVTVAALRPVAGTDERALLTAAVLASTTRDGGPSSDPIDRALLAAATERGVEGSDLSRDRTLVRELPFDSERKRMTVVYNEGGTGQAYMKGAPEVVAARTGPGAGLDGTVQEWAAAGFRVVAVAAREIRLDDEPDDVEAGHELVGVVALHDPLRATAADTVARARAAGIGVRMVTGDHHATARTIGRALGLRDDAVVARATPADKLRLVEELQRRGEVVAVTGDGVNDAPALRRADVGVAMGRSGTEAAREAAAIVLTDDDFSTIVAAIEEGRRIADNVRKFVAFLLSANLGEILVFAVAVVAGWGAPLAVVQVLVVNLLTDGLPALALARDPASALTMTTPPRRGDQLFERRAWVALGAVGVVVGAVTLGSFAVGRAFGGGTAQTMAFATLALCEIGLAFALRSPDTAAWREPRNRWLGASAVASAALVGLAIYLPAAHEPLVTISLSAGAALVATGLALVPLFAVEVAKSIRRRSPLAAALITTGPRPAHRDTDHRPEGGKPHDHRLVRRVGHRKPARRPRVAALRPPERVGVDAAARPRARRQPTTDADARRQGHRRSKRSD